MTKNSIRHINARGVDVDMWTNKSLVLLSICLVLVAISIRAHGKLYTSSIIPPVIPREISMPVPEPSTGCIAQPNNANLNPMSTETHIRRIFASGTSSLATIDVQMANVTAVELVNAWIPSGEYIIDTSNNIIDILYGPASTFGQQDRRMLNTSGTIYERAFAGISDTSDPHETPYRKTITVEPGNYSTSEYITRMAVNNDTIGGRIKVEIKTQQQKVTFSFSNPFTLVFPIDSTAGRLFGLHSVVQHNKTKTATV